LYLSFKKGESPNRAQALFDFLSLLVLTRQVQPRLSSCDIRPHDWAGRNYLNTPTLHAYVSRVKVT
jgi:hypothetical protein